MLTTYLVDSLADVVADDDDITLREALQAANTNTAVYDAPAGSTTKVDFIDFDLDLFTDGGNPVPGTITLDGPSLEIFDTLGIHIRGPGAELLTIDANQQSRVFYVDIFAWVSLAGMTITGGSTTGSGGGIYSDGTILEITNCAVTGNSADTGGGVYVGEHSGCPCLSGLTIANSSIIGNSANEGGGIYADHFTVADITNSIVASNAADWCGGGICSCEYVIVYVTNTTVAGNVDGGGIYNDGELTIWNSIVARNDAQFDPDLSSWPAPEISHSLIGTDPGFVRDPGPRGDGEWGTEDDDYGDLHLRSDSPAVHAGSNALVPWGVTTDLDGKPRIIYETVDIGAYEYSLAGDADYDGTVGPVDAAIVAANWGYEGTAWVPGDVDGDGLVGPGDAAILADNSGATFVPPTEEESSGPSVPHGPATPPLIGPVQADPAGPASEGERSVDSEGDSPIFAARKSGQSPAAHDAVLAEEYGPQLQQTSLLRERLAWSHAMARRQLRHPDDTADKDAVLAIDLLRLDRGR